MIYLLCPAYSSEAGGVVEAALKRSFTSTLVQTCAFSQFLTYSYDKNFACWVLVDPPDIWGPAILAALRARTKIILLGRIPSSLSTFLQVQLSELPEDVSDAARCLPAQRGQASESAACILYQNLPEPCLPHLNRRPFARFDFADEWNNLGYGAIRADGSIWSICQVVQVPQQSLLAEIDLCGKLLSAYAGLWDFSDSSLLWFNRPVGPVDSYEWRLLEHFLVHYRHNQLPCWPLLSEVPYGFDVAVTMRLDCDEDVESARELNSLYQQLGVPFSLALHTSILSDSRHHRLPQEVQRRGGAILSHTATHTPNWGGDYAAAFSEGHRSAEVISAILGEAPRYAVSPFHHTPEYARAGLVDAGYYGCIGGIIHNDPDFLMARAGVPPRGVSGFIGHSQQCMLHGDCLLEGPDPLSMYKAAFDSAKAGKSFFGYLDHPFSERYAYGWQGETERSAMHYQFVDYMKQTGNVLFCNQDQAMDFLLQKSAIRIFPEQGKFRVVVPEVGGTKWQYALEYAGGVNCAPASGGLI